MARRATGSTICCVAFRHRWRAARLAARETSRPFPVRMY